MGIVEQVAVVESAEVVVVVNARKARKSPKILFSIRDYITKNENCCNFYDSNWRNAKTNRFFGIKYVEVWIEK